jgi:hypothetical protein
MLLRALRPSLAAHRRDVRRAVLRLAACRRDAVRQRRHTAALIHDRLTSQETLILTFDAGLTLGMLAPQSRRDAAPAARRPVTHNRALQSLLKAARRLAVRQALGIMAP